jgi:hypothetical protein
MFIISKKGKFENNKKTYEPELAYIIYDIPNLVYMKRGGAAWNGLKNYMMRANQLM